ncbi:DUF983 domain-containing protein [Enterovirga rhinocerotis]|uniref:Uncharacterized protein (DUF983 family) n=1 Tax=Enterovirga rhinocerotis TaxID=1339210 RepID=A0A4V3DXX7_9HYPH|nr:DUF983 domain-containing protein [Enterovirga rhinocerotis]TDR90389.1 uncharacterized protein (DUF983 family) [Enterovirga rhinocerotis]
MSDTSASQNVWSTGLRCRCPRCGEGRLFDGFLRLAPRCEACGLDYSFADPADGPAFFVMMTMAIPVTGFGIWFELVHEPPFWAHLLVTVPLLLLACVPILRPIKGLMVASQYINKAEEARFVLRRPETPPAPPPERQARDANAA